MKAEGFKVDVVCIRSDGDGLAEVFGKGFVIVLSGVVWVDGLQEDLPEGLFGDSLPDEFKGVADFFEIKAPGDGGDDVSMRVWEAAVSGDGRDQVRVLGVVVRSGRE